MKKNFTVSLDQEAVEELQTYLAKFDLTLSGFLNNLIEDSLPLAHLVDFVMTDEDLTFRKSKEKLNKTMQLTVNAF